MSHTLFDYISELQMTSPDSPIKCFDTFSDEDLISYASGPSRGLAASMAYTIWNLKDEGLYTPLSAASSRYPSKVEPWMTNKIAGAKYRRKMTKPHCPDQHNGAGACSGSFLKTMIYEVDPSGRIYEDGRALVRIYYLPRLVTALIPHLKTAPKVTEQVNLEEIYGVVSELDTLKVVGFRRFTWYLEGNHSLEIPEIGMKILRLNQNQLWAVLEHLGMNRVQYLKAGSIVKTNPFLSKARKLTMAARKKLITGSIGQAVRNTIPRVSPIGITKKMAWTFAFIVGFFLAGVTASVILTDPVTAIYIYRTEGPVAAAQFIAENFSDKNADHQTRYTTAFVIWRNQDAIRAEKILRSIMEEDPADYTLANCHYLLGLIGMEKYELYEALTHLSKAENYAQEMPEALELIRIEMSRAFVFLKWYAKANETLSRLKGLSPTNESTLLEVQVRVAMETGKTELALDLAKARYQKLIEIGDTAFLGYALTYIGILEVSMGDLSAATEYTTLAQTESLLVQDVILNHFILCNWIAIYQCSGRDSSLIATKVMEFAAANDLPDLENFLSEANSICKP